MGTDMSGTIKISRMALLMLIPFSAARGTDDTLPPAGEEKPMPASDEKTAPPGNERGKGSSPWAFSLGLYTWLPGIDSELTSGNLEADVEESLFDIIDATKGVPLSIGGRLEAYWKRLGIFVDSNYFLLRFREESFKLGNIVSGSAEVTTQMTFLEYCASFRVFGPAAADRPKWAVESGPPRVDLYAGARTIWLKNEIEPQVLPSSSNQEALTSPLVGVRAEFDIGPRWFFRIDGNVGGFGVDDVEFAGEGLSAFGLRMSPLHVPTELWLGYQVLYFNIKSGGALDRLESDTLLHGPALGLTFVW